MQPYSTKGVSFFPKNISRRNWQRVHLLFFPQFCTRVSRQEIAYTKIFSKPTKVALFFTTKHAQFCSAMVAHKRLQIDFSTREKVCAVHYVPRLLVFSLQNFFELQKIRPKLIKFAIQILSVNATKNLEMCSEDNQSLTRKRYKDLHLLLGDYPIKCL